MWDIIGLYHEEILAVLSFIVFIMLIMVCSLWVKLKRLRKKYLLMIGSTKNGNLEQVMIDLQENVQSLQKNLQEQVQSLQSKQQEQFHIIQQLEERMRKMKAHVGIHRFNAFSGLGHDLSFSAAFVDEQKNGIVITGIHNRDNTYVYAKQLNGGKSAYLLSPEEEQAVIQALNKEQD